MSKLFSIQLQNRQQQGGDGVWLDLPTTTEQVQAALRQIGISSDNPQGLFISGYFAEEEKRFAIPYNMVLASNVDELNFLASRLETLSTGERAELNAALQVPQSELFSIGRITDFPENVDYYVHLPDVHGPAQLGDYYLNRSGMVDMPEEWKGGIDTAQFGRYVAQQEQGAFTQYGYLVKSGDEWQKVHEGQPVPEEYRVLSFPAPEVLRDSANIPPPVQPETEPQKVIPIILNGKDSAERMKEITDRLETGIQELFDSDRYKAYLTTMAKFHNYSFNNTLLIAMQGGQLVAGFNKWKDTFHRTVKKGEKGIKFLAPAPYKVKQKMEKLDEQGKPILDKDGKPLTEEKTVQIPAFKVVSVFDVSQTEGEPLPSIAVNELSGSVQDYQDFFKALEQASPVPIGFEDIEGGAHGYFHLLDNRIAIQEGMSQLQTIKTAIHEIAHAKLHAIDPTDPEQTNRPDSRTREVQAESVAYTVCQHYGLDTSEYSFGYVAGWSSGRELAELKASLEVIRSTAHELISALDEHLAELRQQREADLSAAQETAFVLDSGNTLFIQTCDSGYDYTLYGPDHTALDGGQLDAPGLTLPDAGQEALNLLGQTAAVSEVLLGDKLAAFQEAAEKANEIPTPIKIPDPAAEPTVTVLWSESDKLQDGEIMPLSVANRVFEKLDTAQHTDREKDGYTGGWYDKTAFRIDFTLNGQPDNYEGRQDFGDGEGSLVQHIQNYHEYYAKDENWKNFVLHNKGPEAWEQDKAEREMVLTEFIPYLKQHCNLSAMEQTAATALQEGQNISPEQAAYYNAVVAYVQDCRPLLNQGQYNLPEPPKLTDFDQSLQDYKAQVEAEIAQEAADAGMTVEEYATAGYEAPAQPQEVKEPPQQEAPEQQTKEPAASDYYYSINEGAARRAKEMNSFSDYKPGSATAEYRHYVDKAFALAQEQKKRVDPMYHEKIDSLLDTYARKLAANMNHGYEIDARVPSILIAGGSNFPVRQKEKQNAARDSNMQEWQYIQGLLDKIRSTGMGGIRQDDPQAIPKLQKKLDGLEKAQETMKAVNAYYRKHGTLDGCPHLSPENIENLKADMASGWHYENKPFQSWELSNNNAEIRRVRQRIESLTRANEVAYVGWEFDGGHVEANREQGRLQVFFDGKPEADARQQLKENGFRWAPSVGAWQRLLNDNAYYASDRIACIQPLSGIKPTDLQRNSSREQRAQMAQDQAEPDYLYRVHATPSSDSRENLYMLQAYIPQDNGRAKIGDILYVGTPERCRELMDQLNTGELTQEAVKLSLIHI